MKKGKKIPITCARKISETYGIDGILILGIEMDSGRYCLTTYGDSKSKCRAMSRISEQIANLIKNGEIIIEDA